MSSNVMNSVINPFVVGLLVVLAVSLIAAFIEAR